MRQAKVYHDDNVILKFRRAENIMYRVLFNSCAFHRAQFFRYTSEF